MGFSAEGVCVFKTKADKDKFYSAFNMLSTEQKNTETPKWINDYFKPFNIDTEQLGYFYNGYDDFYNFYKLEELDSNSLYIQLDGRSNAGYVEFFPAVLCLFGVIEYFAFSYDDTCGICGIDILKNNEINTIVEFEDCNIDKQRILELFQKHKSGLDLNIVLEQEANKPDISDTNLNTQDIAKLIKLLNKTRYEDVKFRTIKKLQDIHTEQAGNALLDAFNDEDVHHQAFEAFKEMHIPSLVPRLIEMATEQDSIGQARYHALKCLTNYPGEKVKQALWAIFDNISTSSSVLNTAMESLLNMSNDSLAASIHKKLQQADLPSDYIANLCIGLTNFHYPQATNTLLGFIADEKLSPYARSNALFALAGCCGRDAYDAILAFHLDETIALDVAAALGQTEDPRAVPYLIDALYKKEDPSHIFYALSKYGDEIIPKLLEHVSPEPAFLLYNIAQVLERIESKNALTAIIDLYPKFESFGQLRNYSYVLRRVIVGEHLPQACLPLLLKMLDDEKMPINCDFFKDTIKLFGTEALDHLCPLLENKNHPNYQCIPEILAEIGDIKALPALLNAWEKADAKEKSWLAHGFETVADESILDLLEENLNSAYYFNSAAKALAHIGDDRALAILHKEFKKQPYYQLIEAIGKIANPTSVPFLIEKLKLPYLEEDTRWRIVQILKNFPQKLVTPILLEIAKKDKSRGVKNKAKLILREWEITEQ